MRVLIVDDHTLVRAGIGRLLQALPDVDVVAEACNGQQALDMAAIHRPDLILLDLSLPDRSGLDLLPLLRESLPQTRVVIMSMHNDPTQVRVALDRGCAGFVVKEAAPMELELALRAAASRDIPGALLTADGSDALKQAARDRGYRVLTKPAKPASLRAFLAAVRG